MPNLIEKTLNLSMRPKRLSDLIGQESVIAAIRKHIAKRPPNSWMFAGESGCGKTSIATIMSIAYQCTHMKLWGDPCEECWKNKSSFAIHEINASDSTGKEELGEVVKLSRVKPMNNGKRVIILNEAHKISNAAQNMLLDPTEEPPISTIWIICTTEPSKILSTLQRRFVTYKLKELGITETENFLKEQAKKVNITRPLGDLIEQCHIMQIGSPGKLLQALEKFDAGVSAKEAVSGADSKIDTFKLCKAITSGEYKTILESFKDAKPDESRWIRASIAGWIKGVLMRETQPVRIERAATSLLELSTPPYEDSLMLHWLIGTTLKICKRYRETK